jgi:hypothetical protein
MVGKVALLLLDLLTTPLAAEAQQPRGAHRIGWRAPIGEDHSRSFREALRAGLRRRGNRQCFVEAGGYMSYGADFNEIHQRTAVFIDKILKGAKPADLPIVQRTKFYPAKALGLTISPSVLARADQVIEGTGVSEVARGRRRRNL